MAGKNRQRSTAARSAARSSTTPPPRRMSVDARRRMLLDLGRTVFSERAYDDVATDDLAEQAGISAGLLYHYFGSKRGYYVATIEDVAKEILSATEPAREMDFDQALHRSLSAFVAFIERHEKLYRALVRGGIGSDREVNTIIERLRTTSAQRVVDQLEMSSPAKPFLAAVHGWVGFVEFAGLYWVEHHGFSRDELIEILKSALAPVLSLR